MQHRLSERALAKINLALHVTGRRENGYHDLQSMVVFADIGDELFVDPADEDSLRITGPFAPGLAAGQSNLVRKAMNAFRSSFPEAVPHGLRVELAKNLPVAAGIGGGSADAAAALRIMARLSATPVSHNELAEIAIGIGADLPVCLLSRPCIVRGIGEVIAPLTSFPKCHIVLVNPLQAMGTADVFRALEKRDNPPLPEVPEGFEHASMLGLWMDETRNDLEAPARTLLPAIGEMIDRLKRTTGNVAARMSGSGATVFGLFGSAQLAYQAAQDMRAKFPDYWVAAAPLIAPGEEI